MKKVDKVYVLSVKKYTNRIKHIKNELRKNKIDFEFIFDFDPEKISKKELKKFDQDELSIKHISLIKKHIRAWENAIKNKCKNILVFEDDVILSKDFVNEINKIMDERINYQKGKLIYLGGSDTKVKLRELITGNKIFEKDIATTEAYITDFEACNLRIEALKDRVISLPADHLIKKIDLEKKIKHYWSFNALVQQGSVIGAFRSELDKNRRKHSQTYNILRYRWQKLRRRELKTLLARFIKKCI